MPSRVSQQMGGIRYASLPVQWPPFHFTFFLLASLELVFFPGATASNGSSHSASLSSSFSSSSTTSAPSPSSSVAPTPPSSHQPSPTTRPDDSKGNDSGPLPTWAIIAITAAGGIVVLGSLISVLVCCCRRHSHARRRLDISSGAMRASFSASSPTSVEPRSRGRCSISSSVVVGGSFFAPGGTATDQRSAAVLGRHGNPLQNGSAAAVDAIGRKNSSMSALAGGEAHSRSAAPPPTLHVPWEGAPYMMLAPPTGPPTGRAPAALSFAPETGDRRCAMGSTARMTPSQGSASDATYLRAVSFATSTTSSSSRSSLSTPEMQRRESILSHRSRGFSEEEAERLHRLRHRDSSDKEFGEFLDVDDNGFIDDK